MPCGQESGCVELEESEPAAAAIVIVVVVMEVLFAATFLLGSVLNTLLLFVYCRRRGFRAQISNR